MIETPAWKTPLARISSDFSLSAYHGILLPGGHHKAMRPYLESTSLHTLPVGYMPLSKRTEAKPKVVAAICHGVLALTRAKDDQGKSVLYDLKTTTFPAWMERYAVVRSAKLIGFRSIYFATAPFLGAY